MDRLVLTDHIEMKHGYIPGVCPICVSESYGDPNYVSSNLLSHIKLRHKCNYDELIDRNQNEDDILR